MTETHAPPRLSPAQIDYLAGQLLGRLATAGADHKPHVAPTSFRYNAELGTLDMGGLRVADTKKYRDVQANSWAAIVVDDLLSVDPWRPRFLEIRGRAEAIPTAGPHSAPASAMPSSAFTRRGSTAPAFRSRVPGSGTAEPAGGRQRHGEREVASPAP